MYYRVGSPNALAPASVGVVVVWTAASHQVPRDAAAPFYCKKQRHGVGVWKQTETVT